ncbi:hypothetical protein PAPYR_70 [Paratrimastix pyriformis]|uniref:Leucine-rich repeat-containing protein 51 n=1 Tax=Paratrimastix pyriformis TaxID=342808 RepID=A0ABQ8UUS7_9EUKA|nr:hypothetical protein PAPYR_70 [Paratrimastix pyriformis]
MVIRPQPRTIANNPEATLPPLDFSFLHIPTLESILYEDPRSGALAPEQPASPPPPPPSTLNPQRRGRDEPEVAEKPLPKVYMATVLRLQNNEIPSVEPLPQVLSFILVNPAALTWLDLSFNALTTLDEEAFLCLPSLRTLNLHCNKIADYLELLKLQRLPPLHTLTLHGNPIEQLRFYRTFVVALLQTRNLDFSLVSNQEREKAKTWGRIHGLTDTAIDLRSLQPVMAQRLTQDDPREAAAKPAAARPKGR